MAVTLIITPKPAVFALMIRQTCPASIQAYPGETRKWKATSSCFHNWHIVGFCQTHRLPGSHQAPVIADELAWLKYTVWTDYEKYTRLSKWVRQLQVTNNAAERGMKNVVNLPNDLPHRENVLVNDHRGRVARLRKVDLNNTWAIINGLNLTTEISCRTKRLCVATFKTLQGLTFSLNSVFF